VSEERVASLDRVVADLQRQISEQEEALYSARVLEEARHPSNLGMMLDPDGHAALSGPCGDTMEIFLRIAGGQITVAAFMTDGCAPTVACGSMLTTIVRGKTLEQAAAIDAGDLIIALDGLPPEHVHCATLAVSTLREAIGHRSQESEVDQEATEPAIQDEAGSK
jgi:nitrogen fixation NifU-like protein